MPRVTPSKVACQRCHEKRVRCDRDDPGKPSSEGCTQCEIARVDCTPIISRRGRHRKLPFPPLKTFTRDRPVLLSTSNNASETIAYTHTASPATQNPSVQTGSEQTRPTVDQHITNNVPEPRGHSWTTTDEGLSDGEAIVESVKSTQKAQPDIPERDVYPDTGSLAIHNTSGQTHSSQTPYMVDPSNISYLIREFGHPQDASDAEGRPIGEYLHKAMLDTLGQPTVQHIDHFRKFTTERLKSQGAFDLPTREIVCSLLETFFRYVFPSIPILDKSEFMGKVETNTCSPLLLNAVLMVATIYCPDSLITDAGFVSRFVASLTFYHRAKDIYDAGYETDAITVIQATFLLSHWWSGPLEQKDPWYWLGITAGMAQGIGMHQRKTYSILDVPSRGLWRWLWWIIYAVDIHMSICLDKVPHVSDSFCEIPALTYIDQQYLLDLHTGEGIGTAHEQILFVTSYVQLARTVNAPHPWQNSELNPSSQRKFIDRISEWSKALPMELTFAISRSPWAMLTQINYESVYLLSYRKASGPERSTKPGSPVYEISTRLFRIFEDLMTSCEFRFIAGHVLPATMATLCIHISNVSKGDSQVRRISEHRAQFCLFILKESQESWPIIASVYPFFASLFKRHSNGAQEESQNSQPSQKNDDTGADRGHSSGREGDWLYERLLLDDGPAMSNPSFPFCNLFDIFLTPPSDEPGL
ncbi:fungal-specific transcription factor domain-containing protein [Penicillium angulare]|uniref:Fungal-specific transcription factor domain-containing protein n=1 Tax=Penicillium angulare TaxID=116970 RepID=A0A9W9GC01_9EURO|nr:fungal-specific transcription factor domain-containing protein [Penicillium angulare]